MHPVSLLLRTDRRAQTGTGTLLLCSGPDGRRVSRLPGSLLGRASGAERDPVTDDRADRERDSEPTQKHDRQERCPAHPLSIGSSHDGALVQLGQSCRPGVGLRGVPHDSSPAIAWCKTSVRPEMRAAHRQGRGKNRPCRATRIYSESPPGCLRCRGWLAGPAWLHGSAPAELGRESLLALLPSQAAAVYRTAPASCGRISRPVPWRCLSTYSSRRSAAIQAFADDAPSASASDTDCSTGAAASRRSTRCSRA